MANKKVFTNLQFEGSSELINPRLHPTGTAPTIAGAGHLYYDSSNDKKYLRLATASDTFVNIPTSASGTSTTAFDLGGYLNFSATGRSPFTVSSSTMVSGLNVQYLNGSEKSNALGNNSIPVRDTNNLFHVGSATANPTEDTHVVNKRYADSVAQGLTIIDPAYQATAAALPACTYDNGTNGVGATLTGDANGALTIDGAGASADKRVLIKDQSNAAHNGIYTVTNAGGGSAAFVLTRATDYDTPAEINDGDFIFVQQGATNANRGFVQTINEWSTAGTMGSTGMAWTQFSGAGQITVTSTKGSSSSTGPLIKTGDTIDFGFNATSFDVDSDSNLRIAEGGVVASRLADDAVTPAKLQDTGAFTMGGLLVGSASEWTDNPAAETATNLYVALQAGTSRKQHDPRLFHTNDIPQRITTSSTNTDGPDSLGLVLHNDSTTAGSYSPMLAFSHRENASPSPYKATMAAIYARTPTGTGTANDWIDGELIFATGGATSYGIESKMVLDKNGKLVIGEPTASGTLHVSTARYGTSLITGDYSDFSVSDEAASTASKYGWSTYGSNTTAVTSEQLVLTRVGGDNAALGGYRYFRAASPYNAADLVEGRKYKVSISLKYAGASAPTIRVYDGATYHSSFATLTTTLTTYTTTFEAKSSTNAFIAFSSFNTNGDTITIDNVTIQEDSLASATGSDFAVADDLVINNGGSQAGMTLLGSGGTRIHFGESGKEAHSRIIGTYNSDKDSSLFFAASNNGTAATVMTLFGNDKSAKFEGGVGIGGVIAGTDAVLRIRNEDDSSYWPLVIENDNGNKTTIFTQSGGGDPELHLRTDGQSTTTVLRANGTSYFNGGNVAIGNTAASAKLSVYGGNLNVYKTTTNSQVIQFEPSATPAGGTNKIYSTYSGTATEGKLALGTYSNQAALTLSADGHDHGGNSTVNSATVAGLQDGGACYDFNGTSGGIKLESMADVGTGDITFSAWIKTTQTDEGTIYRTNHSAPYVIVGITDNGKMRATISDGTNTATDENTNGPSVGDGNWHHCVWVFDRSDKIFFYKDGVKTDGNSISSVTGEVTSSTYAALGKRPPADSGTGGSLYFDGEMRDVKVFPSALTEPDVRKLYSGENPKKNNNVDLLGGSGSFDSDTGWTVLNTGWSHGSGAFSVNATHSQTSYLYRTTSPFSKGDTIRVKFDVTAFSGGSLALSFSSGAATTSSITSTGSYEFIGQVTVNSVIYFRAITSLSCTIDNVVYEKVETLVDFNPQSASSTKWRNEALLGFYDGTVNNATLSQGNTYWNNITQSGRNVSIGVGLEDWQTSRTALQLGGNGSLNATSSQAAGGHFDIAQNAYINSSGSWAHINTDEASVYNQVGGKHNFKVKSSGTADTAITWTNGLTVENNGDTTAHGKLGVGGVASDCKLRVAGTSEFENTIFLGDHQGYRGLISWSGDFDSGVGTAHHHLLLSGSNTAANAGIQFKTRAGSSNVDAGVISAQGKWGIGKTNVASGAQLEVHNATDHSAIHITTAGSNKNVDLKLAPTGTGSAYIAYGGSAGNNLDFYSYKTGVQSVLVIDGEGTQDHKGNRIVNSQTVSDSWRSSEPSLRFDNTATTNRVDVSGTLDLGYGDFTLVQWLKTEKHPSHSATNYSIFTSTNASDGRVWIQQTGGNSDTPSVVAYIRNSSGVTVGSLTISGKWQHGVWKHLALTCVRSGTGVGMKLYIDGVEVVSNTTDTSAVNVKNTGGGEFRIGNPSATYQYGGEIKYTSVHNRAMEADEIKGLYNGEATPFAYVGSSNIVNDTGASDNSSSYITNSDSTVTHASDHYTLSNNTTAHGASRYHAFITGKAYRLSVDLKDGTEAGVSVRLQAQVAGSGSWVLNDITTTSSFVTYTLEFTAVTSGNQGYGFWPLIDMNNDNIQFKNFRLDEIGEIAAYTPQSINDKWYDTTSNANHGTITGATTVGDIDHFGILTVKGRSVAANRDINGSGCIKLGDTDSKMARIDYDSVGTTALRIDNTRDHGDAEIEFGLRTSGTRKVPMQILGDGTVKAGSSSGSLKQVARTGTSSSTGLINGNGSSTRFTIAHNLGTELVVVSVREKLNDGTQGQRYAMVETDVRVGNWSDDTTMETNSHYDNVTITFATAPHADADFLVTVIG